MYCVRCICDFNSTIPFFSIKLLKQISHALQKRSKGGSYIYKEDNFTSVQLHGDDFKVHYTPADNLESLFYILIWILILYDGPLGWEWQGFNFESSILGKWSESAIPNLWVVRTLKLCRVMCPHISLILLHLLKNGGRFSKIGIAVGMWSMLTVC